MEVLQLLEQMNADERRTVIEQINALWPDEEPELSQEEEQLLIERALRAQANGFPGRPADEVLDEMERDLAQRRAATGR